MSMPIIIMRQDYVYGYIETLICTGLGKHITQVLRGRLVKCLYLGIDRIILCKGGEIVVSVSRVRHGFIYA